MSNPHKEDPNRRTEEIGLKGLTLANQGDFGERFQSILDILGAGLPGITPTPEGLVLQALYHQARDRETAREREVGALEELKNLYDRPEPSPGPALEVSPMVISGLAIALDRARYDREQHAISRALEAAADRLRQSGYRLDSLKRDS